MDDNRLELIEQPWRFRTDTSQPDWVYIPRLLLLLGWGPGIRETFGRSLPRLRTVIIPEQADISRPPLRWLMTTYDDYFLFGKSKLYENAPSLAVFSAGPQCQSYRLGVEGLYKAGLDCPVKGFFPVSAAPDFGVRHAVDDRGSLLFVSRRTKKLKEKYQERMKQLDLTYAPGTGKRRWDSEGKLLPRTPKEQRLADFLGEIKREYAKKRAVDLEKNPGIRPPDYDERRRAHARSRLGEIQRGKRDPQGRSMRPYTEEALTRRTCIEIARRESDNELHDFSWIDQFSFRPARPAHLPRP